MRVRAVRVFVAVFAVSAVSAALAAPGALAQGGAPGGGGGVTPPASSCAKIAVTNSGQIVRRFVMPDIKYNLENCGTAAIAVTVTITEWASAWSDICPSPVAAPAQFSLALKQKVSTAAPVYRGPCGFPDNHSPTVINSTYAFQGHNLLLTATDDATGNVLGTGFFAWQDCLLCDGV